MKFISKKTKGGSDMKKIAIGWVLAILAGCGGDGGSDSSSISGYVADGYLKNAKVFLDLNNNFKLDAGEPNTTSVSGGHYRLENLNQEMRQHQVVVIAQAGVTYDEENPNQPIANSYLLCAPPGGTDFISPISTLVQERMTNDPTLTRLQAVEQVRTELRLAAGTDPLGNYIGGNNLALQTMAREMVTLMAEQREQIMSQDGTTVDPVRYLLMLRVMNQELTRLMENAQNGDGLQSQFMQTIRDRIKTAMVV
jgi:hypothetical protein